MHGSPTWTSCAEGRAVRAVQAILSQRAPLGKGTLSDKNQPCFFFIKSINQGGISSTFIEILYRSDVFLLFLNYKYLNGHKKGRFRSKFSKNLYQI